MNDHFEGQTVDEIIEQERELEARAAILSGSCPVCWTPLDEECSDIDDDLEECTKYCPRCGWESDPVYD